MEEEEGEEAHLLAWEVVVVVGEELPMMAWEEEEEVVVVAHRPGEEAAEAAEVQRLLGLGDLGVVVVEQVLQAVAGPLRQRNEKVAVAHGKAVVQEFWKAALVVVAARQLEEAATWMEVLVGVLGKPEQAEQRVLAAVEERCSDEVLELVEVVLSSLRLRLRQE